MARCARLMLASLLVAVTACAGGGDVSESGFVLSTGKEDASEGSDEIGETAMDGGSEATTATTDGSESSSTDGSESTTTEGSDTTTTTDGSESTTTDGGGPCDPEMLDTGCATCLKLSCCAELSACLLDDVCICAYDCVIGGGDPTQCVVSCNATENQAATGLLGCGQSNCLAVCT